jgi:hypothetical protein
MRMPPCLVFSFPLFFISPSPHFPLSFSPRSYTKAYCKDPRRSDTFFGHIIAACVLLLLLPPLLPLLPLLLSPLLMWFKTEKRKREKGWDR